jgi:DNA mismatch endonuclease, patch repair protein
MTDSLTQERRRWNMSRIRSTDTRPEFALRSLLHRAGYRFRLRRRDLPGHPDIVLPRYRCVIFVHGCFWHRHPGCKRATMPATNQEKWATKFAKNQLRDAEAKSLLEAQGWRVHVVWECELMQSPQTVVESLDALLRNTGKRPYPLPEKRDILRIADEKFRMKFVAPDSKLF